MLALCCDWLASEILGKVPFYEIPGRPECGIRNLSSATVETALIEETVKMDGSVLSQVSAWYNMCSNSKKKF